MNILNDMDKIEAIDTRDMYHEIIHMPEMVLKAYETEMQIPKDFSQLVEEKIKRVIISGVGSSAVAADIIKACYDKKIPIEVVRDFQLPAIDESCLVIFVSYQGNSPETLSCLKQAEAATSFIGVVTSNGELKSQTTGKYLLLELPQNLSASTSIPYDVFSIIKILESYKLIPNQTNVTAKTIANLIKKAGAIAKVVSDNKNLSKSSAMRIAGKIPLIYAAIPKLFPLAYRWKCQFNIKAKIPAFCNALPELLHNEVEMWKTEKLNNKFLPIIINDFTLDKKYRTKVSAFKQLLIKEQIEFLEFYVEGETLMEKMFSLIYLGDMISFYLAILEEVDPSEACFVDWLKD